MARPTISIQAAIGTETASEGVFTLDTSELDGPDWLADTSIVAAAGSWVELGDRAGPISTRRGRQRLLEQFQAGTLGVRLDNTDGLLSLSGDPNLIFDVNGETITDVNGLPVTTDVVYELAEMQPIKVVATWLGVDYPLIYVYADRWVTEPEYPEGGNVVATGTDAFKIFTATNPPAQTPVGAGDTTGERMHRILDIQEWPTLLRDIEAGVATHSATTLAQPVATQLRLTGDSERGDLYVSPENVVVGRSRSSRILNSRSRYVQWVFGDGDGEWNPSGFSSPVRDDDLKRNDIQVARVGGSTVTRRDSVADTYPYLRRTFTRTDLTLEDDDQVVDYADWVLRLFANPGARIDRMTFEPDGFDDLWPVVLGAQFADRVTVNIRHPITEELWSADYFIEGIDHDIPVEGTAPWVTTFSLADASGFPTNPFILDVSSLDGVDVLI